MKSFNKKKWTLMISCAALLLSHLAFAQSRIEDKYGTTVGYTNQDVIENSLGQAIGYIENNDRISDKYGSTVGYAVGDRIENKYGDTEGYIVGDKIENRYGETVGYCDSSCRSYQVGAASCLLLLSSQP